MYEDLDDDFGLDEYDKQDGDIEQEIDTPEHSEPDIETQLQELEATPGFIEGRLRTSSNPADRAKHEQIMKKRSELIQRQKAEPKLPTEDENLTPEEILKEIETIENTEGFLDGRLAHSNDFSDRDRHKELLERWHKLSDMLPPDDEKPTMQELEERGERFRQASRDMDELVSFGYIKADIPRNLTVRESILLRLQVFSARGDMDGFCHYAFSSQKRAGFSEETLSELTDIARLSNIDGEEKETTIRNILRILAKKD